MEILMENWLPVLGYLVGINAACYVLYWQDKEASRKGSWRISEQMLLLAGLLGGTPAALLAQQRLRHKNRKYSFQIKFWITVAFQVYILIFQRDLLPF